MSEWFKEHAWKACVGETLPRVRIPLSPPPTLAHAHSVSARVVFPPLSADLRSRLRNDCVRYGWPSISQRPNATAFVQPERSIENERRFGTGSATSPIIS